MTADGRPVLLLDVDGPLNPYAAKPEKRPEGYTTHRLHGLRVWLNSDHGRMLQDLPVDLVWATTWEHDANTMIGPAIGLPELPVIEWPVTYAPADLYYKTPTIVRWAADRPFVWVDDEIGREDREYVNRRHHGRALLHRVDPARGLTAGDCRVIGAWAKGAAE